MKIRRAALDVVTAPSNKSRILAVRIGADEYVYNDTEDDEVLIYAAIRLLSPGADPDLVFKGIQNPEP